MKGDLLVVQSKRINSNINQFGDFKKIHGLFLIVYELQKPQEQQQHSIEVKEPIKCL
jgi:hypothetical protein